jgi:hypothetical protein
MGLKSEKKKKTQRLLELGLYVSCPARLLSAAALADGRLGLAKGLSRLMFVTGYFSHQTKIESTMPAHSKYIARTVHRFNNMSLLRLNLNMVESRDD